jgi:integrase
MSIHDTVSIVKLTDTVSRIKRMATRRITAAAVEMLQPGQAIWDSEVKGFGVRRQAATPHYCLKARIKGRQVLYSIGRHGRGYWGPESARREAIRLLGLIRDGQDPAAERRAERATPTFEAFARRYMSEYAGKRKKPRSVAEDLRNLERHVLPAIGRHKLNDINRQAVARLHARMGETPIAANRVLALLSAIMNWAEKVGERPDNSNPCKHLDKYPEKARERYLNGEELARLGDVLATTITDWRAVAIVRLLLLTGGRLSEVQTLQWDYIDLATGIARLPDSKTGAKNLFLSAPALEILAGLPRVEGNPHVVPGDKPGAPFVGIQKAWQRLRAEAGLPDVRLHDLRHSFASAAVSAGDSLFITGKLLGHKQAITTQRYAHLAADPAKAVADRTGNRIAAMMQGGGGEVVTLPKQRRK